MSNDDLAPERETRDVRSDEELRRTREAQEAHGGSMAPGVVDEIGNPVDRAEHEPGSGAR